MAPLFGYLAQTQVSVFWVPGHAAIFRNERADQAATAARVGSAIQNSNPPSKLTVARSEADEALAVYKETMTGHIHFEAVLLHQLRLNR